MNQEAIEKGYFETLTAGHYIDVRYSDKEWKIARIIDRDKRYATIAYDGVNTKQEQVLLPSFKVAPLRFHTEGYTGTSFRAYRPQSTPIAEFKTHLEILQQTYTKEALPNGFTITQYLRGEMFVLVHSLLCRQELKEEEGNEAMKFLLGFIEFVFKAAERAKKLSSEYFQAPNNKHQYLANEKVAFVSALSELLFLLNCILRVETPKMIHFHKSKHINIEMLTRCFSDFGKLQVFADLFNLNDGNARWLPFGIHKRLYYLLRRFMPQFKLPTYKMKDYAQALQIYSFLLKEEQKENKVEQDFVRFIVSLLKEQSTFQAKLRALQELKRIVEDQTKLYSFDKRGVITLLHEQEVLEHMTSEYNFNGEIFKRFIPILAEYCKFKSVEPKNISKLFKIASNRHESEVVIIQEIIYSLCEFIQVDALDGVYSEIMKSNINAQQTIKFIKNFTINAISNYSQQKSFFATFFRKGKCSSKYGYYGLDLFLKEIQDDGQLTKSNVAIAIDAVRVFFTRRQFEGERMKYLTSCLGWVQKRKNYFQGVKVIDAIISTYPPTTYFEDSQREVIEKLSNKHNLVDKLILGLAGKLPQGKFALADSVKAVYEFLQNYYECIIGLIRIAHIQSLWKHEDKKLLSQFLRKSYKEGKKKHIKRLDEAIQEEILTKLIRKTSFYSQVLTVDEFDALHEIFLSYNFLRKKIEVSQRGFVRYVTPEMEGYQFYFQFISRMASSPSILRIIKRTINVFLRPKDERDIDTKINTWKMCLLKVVDRLKDKPEICLQAIQVFFQLCRGSITRENINVPAGSVEVIVSYDGVEKVIILSKNSTLWRLRRQIMSDFGLGGDFDMYSNNMRRVISFMEEQQFSLNALPLQPKGPSISVVSCRREKHIHILAYEKFEELIEKEEMFYEMLFALNGESVVELFWTTVDLLPVNRALVRKIENCDEFNKKNWQTILKPSAKESLQYHLNIVHDLIERNKKWASLFYKSEGLSVVLECLGDENGELLSERAINRCILIVRCVVQVVEMEAKWEEEVYLTLVVKVIYLFKKDINTINISLQTLNQIFTLLYRLAKTVKTTPLHLPIAQRVLSYAIFRPRSKGAMEFIEGDFERYMINNYGSAEEKKQILEYILEMLNVEFLGKKSHCQMMFIFLIDYMNTFLPEQQILTPQNSALKIESFVLEVLRADICDTEQQSNPLIFGSLKLLIYTLNGKDYSYDLIEIFDIFMHRFLFSQGQKRLRHETNLKLTFEALKKILFLRPDLVQRLSDQIGFKLVRAPWRKNAMQSWSMEARRLERAQFCGLQNLGATCYLNSLVQQLFHIGHFREHFLSIASLEYRKQPEQNEIYQLQQIFSLLKYSSRRSITTKKFCDSFINYEGQPINPMVQSDADEFFNALMEKIEEFLKLSNRHDVIENTFEGHLSNQLNCEGCPHNSEKIEHFLSLGVNIRGKKCLQEALDGFVEGEILDGDNAYYCELCEKKVRTVKRMCIKKLPNVLVVVLKRFEFNYDEMRKIKINSYLKFPDLLNMRPYTADYLAGDRTGPDTDFQYSLRGTVIHSGTSQGGHYISFVKGGEKWYSLNDEVVNEIGSKRIEEDGFGGEDKGSEVEFKFEKHKNAYILFYEKVNTSPEYHRNEKDILNDFTQNIHRNIVAQNNNAEFVSVILDDHFLRLVHNISFIESEHSFPFTMLYFFTVVLRGKSKDEHVPNYFRIISSHLQDPSKCHWFLNQINHKFIRQFLIESPRTVRFISTSLIIQAIRTIKQVPHHLISHALFSLKKAGMTPFAKIFTELSKIPPYRQVLASLHYPQRVIAIILEQNDQTFPPIKVESFESYFGTDSSEKEKDREICYASLAESLEQFDVCFADALLVFNKHFSRGGTKALSAILSRRVGGEEELVALLASLEGEILKDGEFKREDLEKYMFLMRAVCLAADQSSTWRVKKCVTSLKNMLYECRTFYDPMDTILREANYIASRSPLFYKLIRDALQEKEGAFDPLKSLKQWLKEADRPLLFSKSDDFKRRTAHLNFQNKHKVEQANLSLLQKRVNWMVQKQGGEVVQISSDMQQGVQKEVTIRNKRLKIKQHLGLIKRVEVQGEEKWGILEKQQVDLYISI